MIYPLPLFNQRVSRYLSGFIDLPANEQTSKYLQSKFLRIWSGFGYSSGRFLEITDYAEYVEITEIHDIENRMEILYLNNADIFDAIKKAPEILELYRVKFR